MSSFLTRQALDIATRAFNSLRFTVCERVRLVRQSFQNMWRMGERCGDGGHLGPLSDLINLLEVNTVKSRQQSPASATAPNFHHPVISLSHSQIQSVSEADT